MGEVAGLRQALSQAQDDAAQVRAALSSNDEVKRKVCSLPFSPKHILIHRHCLYFCGRRRPRYWRKAFGGAPRRAYNGNWLRPRSVPMQLKRRHRQPLSAQVTLRSSQTFSQSALLNWSRNSPSSVALASRQKGSLLAIGISGSIKPVCRSCNISFRSVNVRAALKSPLCDSSCGERQRCSR